MISKKPFTLNKVIHIGFFPKELNELPFEFNIVGHADKIFKVTKKLKEKYPPVETGIGPRHEIPIDELTQVKLEFNISIPEMKPPVELEDAFLDRLSVRDIFAIFNNKPVSNKQFLNDLINKNQ